MKLKKLLSFALALAMVLAFVPALSLTVGAADVSSVASAEIPSVMTEEFNAVDDLQKTSLATDNDLTECYTGWSVTTNDSYTLNVSGTVTTPRIQVWKQAAYGWSTTTPSIATTPGYGAKKEILAIKFIAEHNAMWSDIAFDDIDGQGITAFRIGTDGIQSTWGHNGYNSPFSEYYGSTSEYTPTAYTVGDNDAATEVKSGTTEIIIYVENGIPENGYTVTYYVGGELYGTETFENKTINGFGAIEMARGRTDGEYQRVSLQNLEIYSADYDDFDADSTASVTVKYQIDGTTIDELTTTKTVKIGNTASFSAISDYVYAGLYYNCAALSYANVQEDAVYYAALTADTTKAAATSTFTWDYDLSSDISAELEKGNISKLSDTVFAVAWGNDREGILNFNIPCDDTAVLQSATLNFVIGGQQGGNVAFNIYAMANADAPKVAASPTAGGTLVASYSASLGSSEAVTVSDTVTLDFTECDFDISDGIALRIDGTQNMVLIYGADQGSYAPYISDITTADAITYTVKYVDEDGSTIDEDGTYSTSESRTLGYDDEEIVPYVTIPYFTGYIFTSKSVDSSNNVVTLTYTKTSTVDAASAFGSNFFEGVDDDTQFVSLNMLGAHDAFTNGISSSSIKYDAGGVAQGDSGCQSATLRLASSSTVANYSKAQEKTALELLEAGVRYFDVRLSRSTADASAGSSFLYKTAPHTNGVFYTTHGVLADEFRPIAYTVGQWLKEHPGEVIALYFQEAWDDGNATADTYSAINDILEEAGINDFAQYYQNSSQSTALETVTYGALTDSGSHAGAVMFARYVGYNEGNFYYGSTSATYSWEGKLYSYYDSDNIPSSFDADYLQTQVDTLDKYNEESSTSGDHPVYHMARVMQAQSGSSTLLSTAESDNSKLYTALTSASTDDYNYSEWLTKLPIVMVDGVGRNTSDLAKLLQNCNTAKEITINYVDDSGSTIATATKSVLVGSLYTDETIYSIVDASYDAENGSSVIYSLETLTTKPSTSYNGAVVFTPSYGLTADSSEISDTITIVAAEITDTVYSVRSGILYSSASGVGSDSSNPAFSAYNWNSSISSPDRVGIAIVSVPSEFDEKAQTYELTATQKRAYADSSANLNTYFYIVPIDTYNATDVTDSTALTALFDETLIASYNKDYDDDDTTSTAVSYTLDANVISQYAGQTVAIIGTSTLGLYGLDSDIAIEAVTKDIGVSLVNGAQIRIGDTGLTDSKITDDSGIRFIAKVVRDDTLSAEADENGIGIAIWDGGFDTDKFDAESWTADESTRAYQIPAELYQDTAKTIFTAAITDIDEANFNRIYIAAPYVTVNGKTYYGTPVARTPYEVAAGILTSGDLTGYDYTSDNLIAVLNAYANQTGARITLYSDYSVVEATYANGASAFFTVSDTAADNGDGSYTITLTASGNATFYDYAKDYYRVNGASAEAFGKYFNGAEVEVEFADEYKTMTITFTPASTSD